MSRAVLVPEKFTFFSVTLLTRRGPVCIYSSINLDTIVCSYYELLSAELQDLQELRNFGLSKPGQGFICGKSTIHRSNAEERTNPSMYGTHTIHPTVKLSFQGVLQRTVPCGSGAVLNSHKHLDDPLLRSVACVPTEQVNMNEIPGLLNRIRSASCWSFAAVAS